MSCLGPSSVCCLRPPLWSVWSPVSRCRTEVTHPTLASLAKYYRDPAPGPSQLSDTTRFCELPWAILKGLTKSFDLTIKLLLIQHMIVYSVIGYCIPYHLRHNLWLFTGTTTSKTLPLNELNVNTEEKHMTLTLACKQVTIKF